MFQRGVDSADAARAVERALRFHKDRIEVLVAAAPGGAPMWRREDFSGVHVVAFGKAACAMAKAAQAIIPRRKICGRAIAITNDENATATANTDVFSSGHPIPNEAGQKAARLLAARVAGARAGELVLVLISGGGSALLPSPPDSVALADKIATTELLLASGASIDEVNTVRKHLSQLKGGRLAQLAVPASLHAMILSDVIGNDVSVIASGPSVADLSTYADALDVLRSRRIWDQLPGSVTHYLEKGRDGEVPESPKPGDSVFDGVTHAVIGSNRMSLDAVEAYAAAEGKRRPVILSDAMCGEARDAAGSFVNAAAQALGRSTEEPLAILAGGETTVTLKGSGRGGRNQELALAFTLAAESMGLPEKWVFLSAGTDGRDGPTSAAGGVVDPWTLQRIRASGSDPAALLENNDSNRALNASGDLLITNATGTNVADLQILLIH